MSDKIEKTFGSRGISNDVNQRKISGRFREKLNAVDETDHARRVSTVQRTEESRGKPGPRGPRHRKEPYETKKSRRAKEMNVRHQPWK